jgi:hypothetical protein
MDPKNFQLVNLFFTLELCPTVIGFTNFYQIFIKKIYPKFATHLTQLTWKDKSKWDNDILKASPRFQCIPSCYIHQGSRGT